MTTDTQPMAPTDAELTAIYRAANGEDTGKAQPLTTQRIFRAMRAAIANCGAQPVECEPLIRQMRYALALPRDRWNATQSRIVREAIKAADAWLEGKK